MYPNSSILIFPLKSYKHPASTNSFKTTEILRIWIPLFIFHHPRKRGFISLKYILEVTCSTTPNIRTTAIITRAWIWSSPWNFGNRPGDGSKWHSGGRGLWVSLRDAQTSAGLPITRGLSSTQHELNSLISFFAERQREQSHMRLSQCRTQSVCNIVKI